MKADPRFPNRPTHPDFELLSRLARHRDTVADASDMVLESMIAQYIDLDSAMYLADAQAGLFVQRMDQLVYTPREVKAAVGGTFLSSVVLGIQFEQERARNQPPLTDA